MTPTSAEAPSSVSLYFDFNYIPYFKLTFIYTVICKYMKTCLFIIVFTHRISITYTLIVKQIHEKKRKIDTVSSIED